ncbi:hypothetical protein ACQEVY_30390 [Streptomyces sp. CA-288835]|uniref:hypothetical protein n=1 Tax=Streptomyces sp. CA-288835 TaxID=3240069 RepID=UPI003D8AB01B
MRKSMKLGAASTLAAVALVAGSASTASAGDDDRKDGYICGNTSAPSGAEGEGATAAGPTGFGPATACQIGETNIYNNNQNGAVTGTSAGASLTETITDTITDAV